MSDHIESQFSGSSLNGSNGHQHLEHPFSVYSNGGLAPYGAPNGSAHNQDVPRLAEGPSHHLVTTDEPTDAALLNEAGAAENIDDLETSELNGFLAGSSPNGTHGHSCAHGYTSLEGGNFSLAEQEPTEAGLHDVSEYEVTDSETEEVDEGFEAPEPATPVGPVSSTRHNEFDQLFRQWRETGDHNLRDRLILMNRNLVSFIARKFMDRGEMSEDIMQQGLIGLINALDNFDPTRGTRFATFATPTIMGEIRRYLRDKTWGVRVPRRLHELNTLINQRIEAMTQELDRSPTYAEIARSLSLEVEEVIEALEMTQALDPVSIDETLPTGRGETAMSVGDQIGTTDTDLEGWNDHAILQAALEKLPQRERMVLEMVYFQEQSQTEIARQLKVSQMNISRLQRRALARLRELMNSNEV